MLKQQRREVRILLLQKLNAAAADIKQPSPFVFIRGLQCLFHLVAQPAEYHGYRSPPTEECHYTHASNLLARAAMQFEELEDQPGQQHGEGDQPDSDKSRLQDLLSAPLMLWPGVVHYPFLAAGCDRGSRAVPTQIYFGAPRRSLSNFNRSCPRSVRTSPVGPSRM